MQKNILLKIEYLGTRYFGFQLQDKKGKREISVQQVIERALARLFRKKIRITYSSRTDRGVHAYGQVVNFKVDTKIPPKNIKTGLNAFLPNDVRVKTVKVAPVGFHARFWAKSKIYRYIILNRKEPTVFWHNFSWHIAKPLNIVAMKAVSKKLLGKKDFSLFAKEAKNYKDCIREVKNIAIEKRGSFIYIDIEANGFLRNMVRNIVSFLVKVGEDRIDSKPAADIIKKNIPYHNQPAPAAGLYLVKVKYV
jgi:tRNA pseudouridine38-40 synthase